MVTKRDGREVYSNATHTRAFVEFHSDQNPNGDAIWVSSDREQSDAYIGKLVSVRTHKGFDAVSGSFNIVVKKHPDKGRQESVLQFWDDAEDVWVKIYFIVDGQQLHVMTGLVDSVNETTTRMEGGRRVETLTIAGRDHGKVFETTDMWVNAFNDGQNAPVSMARYMDYYERKVGLLSTPAEWVKFFIEAWVGNNGLAEAQWVLPSSMGGKSFYDLLDLNNLEEMSAKNGKLKDATLWRVDTERGFGKLWNTMSEYSNDFLNELWVDLTGSGQGELKPSVFLRERPFETKESGRTKWESVYEHLLEKGDVYKRSMSKGGAANRYNYWTIRVNGREVTMADNALGREGKIDDAKQGKPGSMPIWNQESIIRHGLRRWEQSTNFLSGYVDEGDEIWPNLAANWLRRAHDWYCVAPMQLQGTIDVPRLLPEIRMGHRLREERDEGVIEYYVEEVSHEWSFPNAGHTVLTLTRGQYRGKDLLAIIYKQMESPGVPTMGDFSDNPLNDVLSGIPKQVRKYEVLHGGDGFELGDATPDLSDLEETGKSLLSEGADPFGGKGTKPDNKMIPPPDRENAQAEEIAKGNPNAKLSRPAGFFGKEALVRGDDPLAGFDTDDSDDPLAGLE